MSVEQALFCDLALSRRLEPAEGYAAAMFADARSRLFPGSGATWRQHAGAHVVYDGVDSPVTQTFGLGIFEPLTPAVLDTVEAFFRERKSPVFHEICPLAGVAALTLLCERGYKPVEISSVLFRPMSAAPPHPAADASGIQVRAATTAEDLATWTRTGSRAWTHEHPELAGFLETTGAILAARENSVCFLAEIDGQPGAAGALSVHEGVALFSGAATVPELRRRGLQAALLEARMRYAAEQGCDLAMMVAEAGSNSQRNAERKGFRIAYTRNKWHLPV